MKLFYKRNHQVFKIIIFMWMIRSTIYEAQEISQKLIGRCQEHNTSNPKAWESQHSNECTESDFFRLRPYGPRFNLPNLSVKNKETVFLLTTMTYFLGHTPIGHTLLSSKTYHLPSYFWPQLALMKHLDSEYGCFMDWRKTVRQVWDNYETLL